jgi:hypothetical protein
MNTPFSLFDGDVVNRLFAVIGVGPRRARDLIARSLILVGLTWLPLAALAFAGGFGAGPAGENFFKDIAAYMQLILGLPLFVVAERAVSASTRDAAIRFKATGVIREKDAARLDHFHRTIERARRSPISDLVCLAIAYVLSALTIQPKLVDGQRTWHAYTPAGAVDEVLSAAGWWELLVTLPLLDYWWLRAIWKVGLWSWYLFRMSRFPLRLVAAHPDRTGGIGFLSDVQTRFGLLILAYGVTNVASTVAYTVAFEGATLALHTVWAPIAGFLIGAPLLFTLPLFMFTKQLHRAKRRALERYHRRAIERAVAFEQRWLHPGPGRTGDSPGDADLAVLNSLNAVHDHITRMRVVPFDMRSFLELMGQTAGSLLPILPYVGVPEPIHKLLEGLFKAIPR